MTMRGIAAGLSTAEALRALARDGPNELPRLPPVPWWRTAIRQVASPLILILAIAGVLAAALGEAVDASVILAVIVLNAILGFAQEWRAERALAALTRMLDPTAMVRRDGQEKRLPARDLVVGDVLLLSTGDRVPADGTLIISRETEIDESVLTGESVPVAKSSGSEVAAGTSVVLGSGEVKVTATGNRTAFAEIAQLTGGIDRRPTRLQVSLGRLARGLGLMAILVGVGVAGLGVLTGQNVLAMVLTAISLAVAMVPEGLPTVVTITLALGAGAMVRKKALVRRMQAIETLGAATVICTDKTGTLTESKMSATGLWTAGQMYDLGMHDSPKPEGEVKPSLIARLAMVAGRCTHAAASTDVHGNRHIFGSPTELALLELASRVADVPQGKPIAELPFTSESKRMALLFDGPTGRRVLIKGAPETVLERANHIALNDGDVPLDPELRKAVVDAYTGMAEQGLRVIALADRAIEGNVIEEDGLCFLGFVGLMDPPRMEVGGAIAQAKAAGIRVIMITGDSPVTARAIARDLGIPASVELTGDELDQFTEKELAESLREDVIFARTRPADKLRIVQALQLNGAVVAMTGDGVNDAPALKRADIGVAMGQRGTDVAQEAADLILLDDNFSTIVSAIEEGRRQFSNIKKFVRYLLSSNAGEVVALVANLVIGGPLIFLATQILWMNLVTDGVTAVALGLEKAEPDQMSLPPRDPGASILGRAGLVQILAFGVYTGSASLFLFYRFLAVDAALANTVAFTAMVVFEKLSVFAFRSLKTPVARIGWFSNRFLILALCLTLGLQVAAVYIPFFQVLLHTVPLDLEHWIWIMALSLPLIVVPEAVKRLAGVRQPQSHIIST